MSAPRAPLRFRGWCCCRRDGEGPLGLILSGRTEEPDEAVHVAFAATAPVDLPDELEEVTIEFLDARRSRISSAGREWIIEGPAHVHREIATVFYRAIPPRPVPWHKRLFWRVVLGLARWPPTRKLFFG